jgi:hypothetical protein
MSERRSELRANSSDRRDILRPPLWLNLLLLAIAAAATLFARHQRQRIDADFTRAFTKSYAGPSELNHITAELAEMDLAGGNLDKELESRMAYLGALKTLDFYLSLDTAKNTLVLKSGNEIVREAKVSGAPPKGAFAVTGKTYGAGKDGSGKYVIYLQNDRVISAPGAKRLRPGSILVPEADLQAIWEKITSKTRVYVF